MGEELACITSFAGAVRTVFARGMGMFVSPEFDFDSVSIAPDPESF
jgi:hypothetical protein